MCFRWWWCTMLFNLMDPKGGNPAMVTGASDRSKRSRSSARQYVWSVSRLCCAIVTHVGYTGGQTLVWNLRTVQVEEQLVPYLHLCAQSSQAAPRTEDEWQWQR